MRSLYSLVLQRQIIHMSPDLAAKIAAIGPVIDPLATAAIYRPLHDKEPYAGIRLTRDIAYGPGERQRLDVFQTEDAEDTRGRF